MFLFGMPVAPSVIDVEFYDKQLKDLENEQVIVQNLCASLQDYLLIGIRQEIKQILLQQSTKIERYKPSPEMLINAKEEVDRLQSQIDQAKEICKDMPDLLVKNFEICMLPMIQNQLRVAEGYLASLQKQMETE